VKTFAQAAIGLLAGDGMGLVDVDWGKLFSVAGLAAAVSVFTSIVSSQLGPNKNSPSVV